MEGDGDWYNHAGRDLHLVDLLFQLRIQMARQVQIFKAGEAEREAVEWLAANPTRYKPEDSGSSVDVNRTVDLFELADRA